MINHFRNLTAVTDQMNDSLVQDDRIRSIVIAGGGTAGWMTAAAFANRVTRFVKCTVTLVESEEIGTIGVGESTLPSLVRFQKLTYGLDEADMIRNVQGAYKLGIQFENWKRKNSSYFHSFSKLDNLIQNDLIPFHHFWMRGRANGFEAELDEFNIGTMSARAGRFSKSIDESSGLKPPGYAYQLDAGLYAKYLRKFAEQRGVKRIEGRIVNVELKSEDGFIDAIELDGGRRIEADLFIDCTGFRGILIEQAMETGYEEWTKFLPCDRAVAVPAEHRGARKPYTRATARKHGWQWCIPLQHRSGNGFVYCSSFCDTDEAIETLLGGLEGNSLIDPFELRFTTGRRLKSWNKNCIAIGLSAGFLEPLESTGIFLIYDAIIALMRHFPDRNFDQRKIDLFNKQMNNRFKEIRDFLVLHYHLNERTDSQLWVECRNMNIPDTLKARIELFRNSGHVPESRDPVFEPASWICVTMGQDKAPERYHSLLSGLPEKSDRQLAAILTSLRNKISEAVESMPTHDEFIESYCAVPISRG